MAPPSVAIPLSSNQNAVLNEHPTARIVKVVAVKLQIETKRSFRLTRELLVKKKKKYLNLNPLKPLGF